MKKNKRSCVICVLIIWGIIFNMIIGLVERPIGAPKAEVGRILVSADDWPISDRYWSTNARMFTLNTFSWLTEFTMGKRILKDSRSGTSSSASPTHNNMVDSLQTNGYTVASMDTTSWTPAMLETYDAVFIEIGPIDNILLTEYVKGGGGVFLVGGHSGSDQYNEFLLNFGMSLREPIYLGHVTLTSFVPHPVTTGVSSLETGDPTPIEVHNSDPLVISTFDGWNWLAVYSKELPVVVPTITMVSPNGGEVWQATQTIMWTATNPQGNLLTYTVYYSPNGGQTWTQLAPGLTESSFLWNTTTVANGANYLIRVEANDGTFIGVDISNEPFKIANEIMNSTPTVFVIRPNGGERIRGMFEIQWRATDPEGDPLTFTLSYSPNGGDTWTQLTSGVTETSYIWDTSGVQVGTTYLIQVKASDGTFIAEDRSDYKFTVEREAPAETSVEVFFVPSFRVIEALSALLVLLGLSKRQIRQKMLVEEQ